MYGSPVCLGRLLERGHDSIIERRCRQCLALRELGFHAAPARRLLGEGGDVARDGAICVVVRAPDVEREADAAGDRVDDPGLDLDLTDGPNGPLTGLPCQALELEDRLGHGYGRIETEVHRRRPGVVAAAVDHDVTVHVAGDRRDDADAIARVLEHPRLLDVHLDPAREAVEDAEAVAPPLGLVAGLFCVLPEAAPVVDRPE